MGKQILFIVPYPVQKSPSQRFRFEQYFTLLKEKGYQITICSFWSAPAWEMLYASGHQASKGIALVYGFLKRVWQLFALVPLTDFVFIHREATPIGPPWFEWVAAKIFKKRIIYDFDDAIWLSNTSSENKIVARLKWHSKVSSICKWSYRISCGNEYLCQYARQFNSSVFLIPTTIDTQGLHNAELYEKKKETNKITIGWTGTHSTLKYLDFIIPIIRSLEGKFPDQLCFNVIADKKPSFTLGSLHFIPWKIDTEIQDLLQFDIGIMPLTDDIWAKGKCGFKALQYMALGIPAVATPVGVNSIIIDDGKDGRLCDSPQQWEEAIQRLIINKELRHDMGMNARKKVIDYYSVTSNSSAFLSLFE